MTKPTQKPSRTAIAIYSDDVRTESGNKLSLMGIYQGFLFVRDMPVLLPKLCITVMVRTPVEDPFKELRLEVLRDGEILATKPIPISDKPVKDLFPDGLDKYRGSTTVVQLMPFEITENFVIRTSVQTESEVINAGALMVVHQPATVVRDDRPANQIQVEPSPA